MLVTGVTLQTLTIAAERLGLRAEATSLSATGTRHRVKLYPTVPLLAWKVDRTRPRLCPVCGVKVRITAETTDGRLVGACGDAAPAYRWSNGRRWKGTRGDSPYQRTKRDGGDGRVHAVCWHGFRDYFRAIFETNPEAIFRTAMDTWRGSQDFEARYRESGARNIGSQFMPMAACDACRCKDAGLQE